MTEKNLPLSMAASAIALRGVRLFLSAGRAAAGRASAERRQPVSPTRRPRAAGHQIHQDATDVLLRTTMFNKHELEALHGMYRKLVLTAQTAAAHTGIVQPAKLDGIDQNSFRDVMHNIFDLVTEEVIVDRVWVTWDRGNGSEGAIKFEAWVRGLSIMLRGSDDERISHCFAVYDLNNDGFITRDEMFILLKNSLLKQPGDEDPDEGVRDLVELVLKKMDIDNDGKISMDDYREAVQQEPLLLEAFGQCLPSKRHAATFLKTLKGHPACQSCAGTYGRH